MYIYIYIYVYMSLTYLVSYAIINQGEQQPAGALEDVEGLS